MPILTWKSVRKANYLYWKSVVCLVFVLVFKQNIVSLHPQRQVDMVNRKADELIRYFLLNDKRSLLVTGARQVGKTFSIRKIGKECFDNVVEINFVEQPDAIELFS